MKILRYGPSGAPEDEGKYLLHDDMLEFTRMSQRLYDEHMEVLEQFIVMEKFYMRITLFLLAIIAFLVLK